MSFLSTSTTTALGRHLRQLIGQVRRVLRLVTRQAFEDALPLKSAALAFVTLLSLVPLLGALSFVGARLFDRYREDVLGALIQVLPFSEGALVAKLDELVAQAENLRQIGALGFVVVCLSMFGAVESTLNKIWRLSVRRSLRSRLLSLSLLLFWGPILIGFSFSALLLLRQRPGFDVLFDEARLLRVLPFAVTLVGLTMLYWLVPHTRVRFVPALFGGTCAAIVFAALRSGFGLYTDFYLSSRWNIYGSLTFAMLFGVSLQFSWLIVLVGCELVYVLHYLPAMGEDGPRPARHHAAWIGLASLTLLARNLFLGHPVTHKEDLVALLHLPPDELQACLQPLIDSGRLEELTGDDDGFLLAGDPHHLELRQLLSVYDEDAFAALYLPPDIAEPIASALRAAIAGRGQGLGERTLADLAEGATSVVGNEDRRRGLAETLGGR